MTKHVDIPQVGRTIAVPEGATIPEAALADGIAYLHGLPLWAVRVL
jgi:naphthalene 1,2-dioxygenase ferredoxin reductase component